MSKDQSTAKDERPECENASSRRRWWTTCFKVNSINSLIHRMSALGHKQTFLTVSDYVRFRGQSGHHRDNFDPPLQRPASAFNPPVGYPRELGFRDRAQGTEYGPEMRPDGC